MKKLLVLTMAVLMLSCTTVNQTHAVYGTVEETVKMKNHYQSKVWTGSKYYYVITDSLYQDGERIRVK